MPIGAAAGVGAAASIGGGILGRKAQKKAIKKSINAQKDVAATNNALAMWNYGQNAARLDPFSNNGLRAGNALNEILLGPQSNGVGMGSSISLADAEDQWAQGALGALGSEVETSIWKKAAGISDPSEKLAAIQPYLKARDNQVLSGYISGTPRPVAGMTLPGGHVVQDVLQPATDGTTPPAGGNALSAWDQFKQGSMYQGRLQQGLNAVDSMYAARGANDSGAARLALQERGQLFASNELGNWMNMLANQQGVGMGAASALAGVGQNLVSNVTANNNNAANAVSNGALANGQATANMWSSIGQGVGQIAGALGSSYGGGGASSPSYGFTGYTSTGPAPSWYQGIG